jgi:hypothetical protein
VKNLHLTLVPLGIVLLVAGCGGGGSSAGGGSATIPTAAVQITSSNATKVAAGANNSTSTLTSTANSTSAPATPTGVVVGASSSSLSVMNSALNGFNAVRNLKFPAIATGAVTSNSLTTCTTGSGTASWNDVNANLTFDAGDILSVTYVNCVTAGIKRNGSASFTIGASSFSLTYTGYSEVIPSPAETLTMDGDMTLSVTTGTTNTISMTGTSIEANSSLNGHFKIWGPGIAAASANTPYSTVITLDNANNYTYAVNMSIASTDIGGSVSIVTFPAFAGVSPANPTTGTMTITGAKNTVMTLTAATATQYSVTVTENGTTTYGPQLFAW